MMNWWRQLRKELRETGYFGSLETALYDAALAGRLSEEDAEGYRQYVMDLWRKDQLFAPRMSINEWRESQKT